MQSTQPDTNPEEVSELDQEVAIAGLQFEDFDRWFMIRRCQSRTHSTQVLKKAIKEKSKDKA